MNEFEIVKHIMMLNGISYDELSEKMGYKSKSSSFQRLNGKHLYVDTWLKFLSELGYEVVVRKTEGSANEYIISDTDELSPLRFRGMNLNLEAVMNGTPRHTITRKTLTLGERRVKTRALRERVSELSFQECDKELRDIWDIKDVSTKGKQPFSEYLGEYENYRRDFIKLYEEVNDYGN